MESQPLPEVGHTSLRYLDSIAYPYKLFSHPINPRMAEPGFTDMLLSPIDFSIFSE
jgi:hypothetical protein